MMLLVEGFPSQTAALQFEWQWQHPKESRAILDGRRSPEPLNENQKYGPFELPRNGYAKVLRDLHMMLRETLWSQYPLRVVVFDEEYFELLQAIRRPLPSHISISKADGPLGCRAYSHTAPFATPGPGNSICSVCEGAIVFDFVDCSHCKERYHAPCLLNYFIKNPVRGRKVPVIPNEGRCRKCKTMLKWPVVLEAFYERQHDRRAIEAAARAMRKRQAAAKKATRAPSNKRKK